MTSSQSKVKSSGFVNVVFNAHVSEDRPDKTLIFFEFAADLFPKEVDNSLNCSYFILYTIKNIILLA